MSGPTRGTLRPAVWGLYGLEGERVWVYRNLHKDCLSVRHNGLVVAYTREIFLEDVDLVVQPAGRARVLRQKRKNVHAFIKGRVVPKFETIGFDSVYYNPYKVSHWTNQKHEAIFQCKRAAILGSLVLVSD